MQTCTKMRKKQVLWPWKAMKKWVKVILYLHIPEHTCVYITYCIYNLYELEFEVCGLKSPINLQTLNWDRMAPFSLSLSADLGICAHRWSGRQRNVTSSNSSLQVWALYPSNSSVCRQVWICWYLAPQAHVCTYSAMCCWGNMLPSSWSFSQPTYTIPNTQLSPLLANGRGHIWKVSHHQPSSSRLLHWCTELAPRLHWNKPTIAAK